MVNRLKRVTIKCYATSYKNMLARLAVLYHSPVVEEVCAVTVRTRQRGQRSFLRLTCLQLIALLCNLFQVLQREGLQHCCHKASLSAGVLLLLPVLWLLLDFDVLKLEIIFNFKVSF
jgi:hypothetical protein